ncbi:MAG: TlpA family protein disulfide reductase [Chlorobi bacterium]|nr:TlpA family protein disulfide reductase [Chlorobiota bacterium]
MKKTLISAVFIFLFSGYAFAQQRTPDKRGFLVRVGDDAPDFTMTLADDGKTVKLSDLRGKVVMLQFTASWCGVCRKEMPHIESEIWQAYKDKGLHVYAIDRDEPKAKALMLKEQTGITYPIGLDPGADIFGLYAGKKEGVTRNVLIDRNGKIIFLTRLYNVDEFSKLVEKIGEQFD